MKQSELIALIERTAPLAIAAPWDKSGVQVASARQDINRLAVCRQNRSWHRILYSCL